MIVHNKEIYLELSKILNIKDVLIDEPMKKHTSFKIGGPVDFFLMPRTVTQLMEVIGYCKSHNIPFYVMGNGSNLLVMDEGYKGIIIQVYKNLSQVTIEDTVVKAEAGILLSTLANKVYNAGLTGFEFASGIPGTLGGAVCMNAGAYGGELKNIITSATVINESGELLTLSNTELELGYRDSIVQRKGYIVVSAELKLEKGNKDEIRAIMEDLTEKRTTKQPLELPSAGSTFKRPEGYYAGKLIMDSDLRGFRVGDAQVSEKHCGFVVNVGEATAADVLALIKHIQRTVKEKFGVDLEPEVRILG